MLFVLVHIEARTGNACDTRATGDTSPTKAEKAPSDNTADGAMTYRNGSSIRWSMLETLRILHYHLGRQKRVHWSLSNDDTLSEFVALAAVEPYLYSDSETGEGRCGSHEWWRPLVPTSRREQTPIQFAYRAMLWINLGVQAAQVPIDLHHVFAATIQTAKGTVLVISAYGPNDRSRMIVQDRDLYGKLALIRQAIDRTEQKYGDDIEVLLRLDFSRHNYPWGGQECVARGRRNEAVPLAHFAQEYGLHSMLPASTIV